MSNYKLEKSGCHKVTAGSISCSYLPVLVAVLVAVLILVLVLVLIAVLALILIMVLVLVLILILITVLVLHKYPSKLFLRQCALIV